MSDVQSLYGQARKLTLSVANGIARLESSMSKQVRLLHMIYISIYDAISLHIGWSECELAECSFKRDGTTAQGMP